MATAILRSHYFIGDRIGSRSLHASNRKPNPNPNPKMSNVTRCRGRKRDGSRRFDRDSMSSGAARAKGLVMGQVKILKRGEELKPRMFFGDVISDDDDLDLYSTDRMGPDPEVVQKQIRVPDLYASLVSSPPPSDLPFPTALVSRNLQMGTDLRKLLKI